LCLSSSGSGGGSVCIDAAALTMLNTAASRMSKTTLVSAKYGSGSSTVDVTSRMQIAVEDPNTAYRLSHESLFYGVGDPANGKVKKTTILYIPPFSTVAKTAEIPEGQTLKFSSLT
jgi:hypothetical protein